MNLYAKWTANTYNYTYDGNKPSKAPSSYEVTDIPTGGTWTYDGSTEVTLGSAPSLTGYVFDGWYRDSLCTGFLGNAGQSVYQPNLTPTQGGNAKIYAKWKFNAAVQDVVDKINNTKTCDYEDLTDTIEIADDAYNALPSEYQAVVDSEGYTHILDNAKAADAVGKMIEALGPAEDTPEWRKKVADAREAYDDLEDKTFIPTLTILRILEDNEAAVVVMDLINDIGDARWTPTSKDLIDTAQEGYDIYIADGRPAGQIANHDDLVYANEVYDNVQSFVDNVNAITNNPFEYTSEVKELIDIARNYYENGLDQYQKDVVALDADNYYDLLVNYENAYNAMYLIDEINDMENNPACGERIKAARDAVSDLDPETEIPLLNADLVKELNDKEAGWGVMVKINAIYPMSYSEETEKAIQDAIDAYNALEDDQEQYVVNLDLLTKAITDYNAVKKVVEEVNDIGDIRHDKESLDKIQHARGSYEALTLDQKGFYPNGSLQSIVDYETAYVALDKIYEIREVNYDTDSETKIEEARDYYDSLSDAQKRLIHISDLKVLTNAETEYNELNNKATTLVVLMLIFVSLLVLSGLYFLFLLLFKKRNKDDDENKGSSNGKKGEVKAMSLTLLPVLVAASNVSHYLDPRYIALYVLAGLAVLIWLANVAIYFLVKKGIIKAPFKLPFDASFLPFMKEKKKVEAKNDNDEDEVITMTDEKGNRFQIRFIKSFTAKLIQSSDETKAYYTELKNEVLSYKKANSRVSWHFDSINAGREYLIKFGMRGKTLCVYYPLNADEYENTKYKVEKVEAKKYTDVPCLYRINNDRRLSYAKELIAVVSKNMGLEKGEVPMDNYYLPYEDRESLLKKGLIKELKVSLNETPKAEVVASNDEEEVVRVVENGVAFEIRFHRSYNAKLIQASDEAKSYYNELKNYIFSYKGVSNRVSWNYESFNSGRDQLIKFNVKGKTLCVYYALDVNEFKDTKYLVEEVNSKRYEEVPCLYRIKNPRRCSYAKELIDLVMKKFNIEKGKEHNEKYDLPYETREPLLARGLIKEVKTKIKQEEVKPVHRSISVFEADATMSDEVAASKIIIDSKSKKHNGKKAIINIDTIGEKFNDGDVVTIESLIEKKLVPANTGYVKVLARGSLSKKLEVDVQEYSIQAVKMILLEGGTVKKAK